MSHPLDALFAEIEQDEEPLDLEQWLEDFVRDEDEAPDSSEYEPFPYGSWPWQGRSM